MGNSKYICESHIKRECGVPPSLSKKHFGEPDKTIRNPHCPSDNRRIKLFARDRIEQIMETEEFQEDLDKFSKRF